MHECSQNSNEQQLSGSLA